MNSLFILVVAAILSSPALAETVKLKNGTVLKGVIVEMNQNDLIIDTAEMGRVTVKRYTIQKISDDEATNSGGGGTVINVNNSNQVEQTNSQVNNQNTDSGKDKPEARRWRQGIQGRFNFAQESVNFKQKNEIVDLPKSYTGINWDMIGFRSESWWAVYLEVSSQSMTKNDVDYNVGGGLIRLDWNAIKSVNGDTLSLAYFGIGVGSGAFEAETTDINGIKTSVKFSGSRASLRLGYDYFWGKYWGLSAFAAANTATFDKVTYRIDGIDVGDESMDKVSAKSTSFGLGLLYNIDL
ncbi:MAG TPA: hypothetical protein VE954_17645 [Oligoflexus sp.]|uniref:hypothetical protein n=1 Tax=Oligoflexus sp. TaxID=1971216 RepID=UPI002D4FCEF6|nr:hypothetical protein [Oligoflexus sp.]HYX34924.1 hypothetical protein [Oligoflexus sp.]